eukprot:TRINITY_DN27361_c0_g3_i1.p1 TRINITY_DN27361_c0_g3~~TRINITY_DN27361_c0_g3_i1.p1  ORF type:complete len:424 (-),score=39.28 TRINITY_DN27361_c0_g3_i1:139-1410(-)
MVVWPGNLRSLLILGLGICFYFLQAARREERLSTSDCEEFVFTRAWESEMKPEVKVPGGKCKSIWLEERSSGKASKYATMTVHDVTTPICYRKRKTGDEPNVAFYGIFQKCEMPGEAMPQDIECEKIDNAEAKKCEIDGNVSCCTQTNAFNSVLYTQLFVYRKRKEKDQSQKADTANEKRLDLLAVMEDIDKDCSKAKDDLRDLWHSSDMTITRDGGRREQASICYRERIRGRLLYDWYGYFKIMKSSDSDYKCGTIKPYRFHIPLYKCEVGGWSACCSERSSFSAWAYEDQNTQGGECRGSKHIYLPTDEYDKARKWTGPKTLEFDNNRRQVYYYEYDSVIFYPDYRRHFCFTRTGEEESCSLASTETHLGGGSDLKSCVMDGMYACCKPLFPPTPKNKKLEVQAMEFVASHVLRALQPKKS